MKKTILVSVLVLAIFCALGVVNAQEEKIATVPDVSLSKLIENLTLATPFGNVYFNLRDMHNLIHAAAKLKPINLGYFVTDKNMYVKVKALAYDRGKVTFDVVYYGSPPVQE